MKWMKWLVVLVVVLLVASIPTTDAWAKGKDREKDKGNNGEETPTPSVAVATPERENSVSWFVMDRTDPTRRLAGPFYAEQSCRTSALGFNNAMCRAVRD